ncbi:thiamine-triphosphatase-like isoform X2 [Centruroides vittatus]|uniref:thiamine-triphosphatase-like isoform X2 n=1 Tax=Centruroides vittatus TaxID=120091 RepID=UPI00350EEB58
MLKNDLLFIWRKKCFLEKLQMEEKSEFIVDNDDYVIVDIVKDELDINPEQEEDLTTFETQELQKLDGSRTLEIERKFIIPNNCEEKIKDLGGHLEEEEEFTDHYYDTSNYKLTLKDRWLRSRSGKWQMKYPMCEKVGDRSTTKYYETEKENEIISILNQFGDRCFEKVQDFVRSECQPIAVIRTRRKTYKIKDARVCLDLTDFGFQTGEVEVIVREEKNFSEALQFVNELAFKLGGSAIAEGKVENYLRTRKSSLYDLLVKNGVLNPC